MLPKQRREPVDFKTQKSPEPYIGAWQITLLDGKFLRQQELSSLATRADFPRRLCYLRLRYPLIQRVLVRSD
jgi:hypothetical protein